MSKIDELILQYCPNGIEFKQIGEITKVLRGRRLTKSLLSEDEKYPVFHGGLEPLGKYQQSNRQANTVMIINVGASAGTVGFSTVDFWSSDGCYCLENNESFLSRFIYHYLLTEEHILRSKVRRAGIPTLDAIVIEKIYVPIPPLPIQEEIVKILDKFTSLEAELEAELEARKRQYEYYRNQLLAFEGKEVEWKTLREVGEFIRGSGLQKSDFAESGVGCIHYGQIYTFYGTYATKTKSFVSEELAKKLRKAKRGDLIIAGVSENIEDVCKAVVWLGEEDICISGDSSAFRHNQNPKFIGYLLQTDSFFQFKKKYAQGAKVTRLRSGSLPTFRVPVPAIEEQERIVKILDQFDALVNDVSIGLPAVIKARREQYEYYRGKLLTFQSLVNS
ncbi:restriction endonuclease subunit S [Pedobacter sp. R20-19]|uniref:restriction endonuclease subunit S n=1 Tax=Pedobacter sp. R20-19 TaxID=1270196 RepID=UPI00049372E5|nr:restriction endonuclease subunit S [Pedobacter sp. R20-19]